MNGYEKSTRSFERHRTPKLNFAGLPQDLPPESREGLQSRDGQPIALLSNYSTHYVGAPPISADYFAVFCDRIAEMIGATDLSPPFVAMLSNGTSGDANCIDFERSERRQFDRFTVGEDVARAAFEAYQTIQYYDWVPLVVEERLLTLDVRMPSGAEVAEAGAVVAELPDGRPRNIIESYARETVLLSQMPPSQELKLQAIRIGELGITALPVEAFGSTGLEIKQRSPLKPTFNISLANGYFGYIPPPDQHKLGGYTTWRARTSNAGSGRRAKDRGDDPGAARKRRQPAGRREDRAVEPTPENHDSMTTGKCGHASHSFIIGCGLAPVFDGQAADTTKMLLVVGHQGSIQAEGVCRNE